MSVLFHLLKRTGLNDYESRTYAALLELSDASAADISRKAAVPRARVYDVLVGLQKKGFVSQSNSRPIRFNALSPETALSNLVEEKKRSFDLELSDLSGLKGELSSHALSIKKPKPVVSEDSFLLLSGKTAINSKIGELLQTAKEETVICSNELAAFKKAGLLEKVFSVEKPIAKISFFSPCNIELKQKFSGLNAVDFKQCNNASRFMVFDNKKALLFLDAEPSQEEKAVLVHSPHFSRYLKESLK